MTDRPTEIAPDDIEEGHTFELATSVRPLARPARWNHGAAHDAPEGAEDEDGDREADDAR